MNSKQQFRVESEDLGLLESVLNEVLNGFEVPDFDRRIGMNRADMGSLFQHLRKLDNRDPMTVDIHQTRAFRNALFETIRELGVQEFHTRTGYDLSEGDAYLERLDQFLGASGIGDYT